MKKIVSVFVFLFLLHPVFASEQPILSVVPVPGVSVVQPTQTLTRAAQKKAFKARRKLIAKLVKAYHKATPQEKPAILAQLQEAVTQNTQAGLTYVKERISAERANLDSWENKVKQDEANLAQLSAQRVEALLSKDAKKEYKARRKAWKKQIKEARKKMR